MYATTISSKYQVVIPREVRKQFGLKPGQKIMFIIILATAREKLARFSEFRAIISSSFANPPRR